MTPPPRAPELTDVAGTTTAVIRGIFPVADLADFCDQSFTTLAAVTSTQDVRDHRTGIRALHRAPGDTADLRTELIWPVSA